MRAKLKNRMIVERYKRKQKAGRKERKVGKKAIKKRKTKIKQKPRCPKCGSTDLARGYGDFYFCRRCGAVIKKKI